MKCKEVRKRLGDYASGDLKPEVYEMVSEHLKLCIKCSALLEELNSTMRLINKRERLEPNPFLYTRIKEKLHDSQENEIRVKIPVFRRVLQPVMLSLLLAGAIFTGIKLGDTIVSEQEQTNTYAEETEYYLNDMEHESLEVYLLSDLEYNNNE
jgi:predicted anti-sigma-YlaC factor YlaD